MLMNLPEVLKGQNKPKMMRFKPIKVSRQTELWYSRQLVAEVKALRNQVERALQQPQSPFLMDSKDEFSAFDTQHFLSIIKKLAETDRLPAADKLAREFVARGNQQNEREVGENLKRQTGVDLQGFLGNSPKLAEKVELMTTANVQLIKSINNQYLDKVQTAVTQAVLAGKMPKELAKEIKEIGNVTEKRARFIARDQSAKLNGALTQARHEELGITKYRWSTSGDERVRNSHAENDGKVFSYAEPPETGHPGQGINCRCVAIPVLNDNIIEKNNITEENRSSGASNVKGAELLRSKAEKVEPKITNDVVKIISSVGGKTEGLEYRLKSLDSLKRKIKAEMLAGLSEKQAAENIRDVVRYTAIFDGETFVTQYHKMQSKLAELGYHTTLVKNTWKSGAAYKGVNTFISSFIEKDNVIFEMQYHTQQSFELKNGKLHQLYEKFRDPDTPQQEKSKILLEMQKLSANLKVPKDIDLIKGNK